MNRSFLLPLGVCLCGLASAAGPSKVCISITDPAGLPIARARILVSPQQEQATFNGETNDTGSFCRNYAPGRYVVRAESEGFLASSIPFTAAEASQELEIRLGLASTTEQVQVTAARAPESLVESPTPVLQVNRTELENLGARTVSDALQEQASVLTFAGGAHSGGASTNVDGFDSSDVQVLIDGQPIVGRINGYINAGEFDAGAFESVEIKPGASSVMYGGQGMGGAINMITRRASAEPQFRLESGYGSFNTLLERASGGFTERGFSVYLSAFRLRSLGYDLESSLGLTQPANDQQGYFANIYLPPWKRLSLGVTTMWTNNDYWGYSGDTGSTYDFDRYRRRLIVIPRGSLVTSSTSLLTFRLRHIGYRGVEDLAYRETGVLSMDLNRTEGRGGEADWAWTPSGPLRIGLGGSVSREEALSSRLAVPGNNASRDVRAGYTTIDYRLRPSLKLQAGGRVDSDSIFGSEYSPQLGLAWQPVRPLSFSFQAARGYRAPNFNELYTYYTHAGGRVRVIGNPNLSPQRSWSYTASGMWRSDLLGSLEVRLFYNDLRSMIQSSMIGREGIASIYQYRNIGYAEIYGAALNYRRRFGKSWDVALGYQHLSTRDDLQATPLEYSPRHRATGRLGYYNRAAGLTLNVFANATGRTYYGLVSNVQDYMAAFETTGITAIKTLWPGFSARLTLRNLSDSVDPAYRLTAPRGAEVALIYDFNRAR